MADYLPGKMPIEHQQQNYAKFWNWSIRVAIIVAVILVLMYALLT